MMLQLNPSLPLITPKGKAYAHFLLDYSQEHDLMWVCFICETGECWTYANSQIRMEANMSLNYKSNNQQLLEAITRQRPAQETKPI
jgi:hypothetical protein